jgi:type II secretory pathway pseudopilin PulG
MVALLLFELLVVISIIALLSSIILAALSNTRIKGKNGNIQEETVQLRNQIELGLSGFTYSDLEGAQTNNGQFVAYLGSNPPASSYVSSSVGNEIADILSQNSLTYPSGYSGGTIATGACAATTYKIPSVSTDGLVIFVDNGTCQPSEAYAIFAAFGPTLGSSGYYCVDSSGHNVTKTSGSIPTTLTTTATCQ